MVTAELDAVIAAAFTVVGARLRTSRSGSACRRGLVVRVIPPARDDPPATHSAVPVDNDNAPHLMKAMSVLDLRDKLESVHCPALVIYGSRDAAMVVGGQMLASGLPNCEVRVLADLGHEVFLETPTEAFGIIRHFLQPD